MLRKVRHHMVLLLIDGDTDMKMWNYHQRHKLVPI